MNRRMNDLLRSEEKMSLRDIENKVPPPLGSGNKGKEYKHRKNNSLNL